MKELMACRVSKKTLTVSRVSLYSKVYCQSWMNNL